jgi:hypothetical protein
MLSIYGAQSPAPNLPSLLWSAEVLQEDFQPLRNPLAAMVVQRDRPGVVFLDDERVIVYEVGTTGKLTSRTNSPVSSSFALHASILNSEAGVLVSTKDWPTHAHYSSIHAAAAGLLLRTGNTLTLLSKDFGEIERTTLPDVDRCVVNLSATERTILVNCFSEDQKISHFEVFDGNTLELKYSWSETPPLFRGYSINDNGIFASDVSERAVIYSKFESHKWDRVFTSAGACPQLFMSTLDAYVFSICKDLSLERNSNLTVSSLDRRVLITDKFDKGENLSEEPSISQNGRVVALSLDTIKLEKRILAEPHEVRVATHVTIFDLSQKKRILTINISPLPKEDYDLALSPDGSKLAVLNDRRVYVYALPNE